MNREPTSDLNANRVYCKLEEIASRLNQISSNNVRVNVNVPAQQYTDFCINIKNKSSRNVSHSGKYEEQLQFQSLGDRQRQKVYQIDLNEQMKKEKNQKECIMIESYKAVPQISVINEKINSSPYLSKIDIKTSSINDASISHCDPKNQSVTVSKLWQSSSQTTTQKQKQSKQLTAKPKTKMESSSPKEYLACTNTSFSAAMLDSMKGDLEKYEKRDEANLDECKKTAMENSNRLSVLNQKLRNSFLKWNYQTNVVINEEKQEKKQITRPQPILPYQSMNRNNQTQNIQVKPLTKPTIVPPQKTSVTPPKVRVISPKKVSVVPIKKVNVTSPKKTTPPKIKISPPQKISKSRVSQLQICSSQCSCDGNRQRRTKRSISPFFNSYDYKSANISHIIYNPSHFPLKEDESNKKIQPINCRNPAVSSKDMNKLISDVRSVYKMRGQEEEFNLASADSNKRYVAHKLTKNNTEKKPKTSSFVKSRSISLSPLQGCYHRCLICKKL